MGGLRLTHLPHPPTSRALGPVDRGGRPGQLGGVKRKSSKIEEAAAPYVAKKMTKAGKTLREFTAIIQREDDGFVALCPELDVASQGNTVETARLNLAEAVQLFLETASRAEIAERLHGETYVTKLEVVVG